MKKNYFALMVEEKEHRKFKGLKLKKRMTTSALLAHLIALGEPKK